MPPLSLESKQPAWPFPPRPMPPVDEEEHPSYPLFQPGQPIQTDGPSSKRDLAAQWLVIPVVAMR